MYMFMLRLSKDFAQTGPTVYKLPVEWQLQWLDHGVQSSYDAMLVACVKQSNRMKNKERNRVICR